MVIPSAALIARRPYEPSVPVPDSTTPTPWFPQSSAIDSSSTSTLGLGPVRTAGLGDPHGRTASR